MKLLILLALLAFPALAADITTGKKTFITIGGGVVPDPSKLPLSGGTMYGALEFSTSSVAATQGGVKASTDVAGGIEIASKPGFYGASVVNFVASGSDQIVLLFSTSSVVDVNTAPAISYYAPTGDFSLGGTVGGGAVQLSPGTVRLLVNGFTPKVELFTSSAVVTGSTVKIDAPTIDLSAGSTLKLNGSPNAALCINASGNLSTCSSAVGLTGACTCP